MGSACLIHGHGVDASIWDGIYADLVLDTPVQKPDLAQISTLMTIEAYADELKSRLDTADYRQTVLVGHSMGGYIALAFAEKYPQRVSGLVLYHSTPVADDESRRETRRHAVNSLAAYGSAPFIRQQLPRMVAPEYPVEKVQQLVEKYQSLPANALMAGMNAMAARPDRTHVLRKASYPILLVLGRDDQIIPFDKASQLADVSATMSVAVIEQAGHLSMIEQPQQALRILRSFLNKS